MSGLVYVYPAPVSHAGPDAVICVGNSYSLNGSGGTVYDWSPASYLSATPGAHPVFNAPAPGVFNYLLRVADAFGCISINFETVATTVFPAAKVFAGNDTALAINQLLQLQATDVNGSGFKFIGSGILNANVYHTYL